MTRKDQISILLSVFALTISFISLYLSPFHVSQKLEAVVLEADISGANLSYEVAIINPGNRRALVTSASIGLDSPEGVLYADNPFKGFEATTDFPLVVGAEDFVVISFNGPVSFDELYGYGGEPDQDSGLEKFNGDPTRKIGVVAFFTSMNFEGKLFHAETDVLSAHITRSNVAGWGSDGVKRSLFVRQ